MYQNKLNKLFFLIFGILFFMYTSIYATGSNYSKLYKEALTYYKKGDYSKALNTIRTIIFKLKVKNYDVYLLAAKVRYKKGDIKLAKKNLEIALKYNPNGQEAKKLLAQIRKQTSYKSSAKSNNVTKKSSKISSKEELYKKLDNLITDGQYEKAISLIHKYLKKYPNDPGLFYYAGIIRFEKGEYKKAIINLTKALKKKNKFYRSTYYLAMSYEKLGQIDKAIVFYEDFIRYPISETFRNSIKKKLELLKSKKTELIKRELSASLPKSAVIKINNELSLYLSDTTMPLEKSIYNEALKYKDIENIKKLDDLVSFMLNIAAKSNDKKLNEDVLWNIANIYNYLNLYNKVLSVIDKLITNYPNSKRISLYKRYKVEALIKNNQYDKALKEIEKNLKEKNISLDDKIYYLTRKGLIYEKLNQKNKAIKTYKSIITLIKNKDEYRTKLHQIKYKIAINYIKNIQYPQAKKILNQIIQSPVESEYKKDAILLLADLEYKTGNSQAALKLYKFYYDTYSKIEKDNPNNTWVLYQIGNCYRNLEKYDEAINTYKKLIQTYSSEDPWVKNAKWKLDDTIWYIRYKANLNDQISNE